MATTASWAKTSRMSGEGDLDLGDIAQRIGDVADALGRFDQRLHHVAGRAGFHFDGEASEARTFVGAGGPHGDVGELDVALLGHVVERQREAAGQRGQEDLAGLGPGVLAAGLLRFVDADAELAGGNGAALTAVPRRLDRQGLVAHASVRGPHRNLWFRWGAKRSARTG